MDEIKIVAASETTASAQFKCECEHIVYVNASVPGRHEKLTVFGIACNGCDRTYTVELTGTSKWIRA